MGYFDALTSGSFKTTPDGRHFFFPWGVLGRGYAIDSEDQYVRLHRAVKIYMVASITLIIAASATQRLMIGVAVAAAFMVLHVVAALVVIRRLRPTDEKLTYGESLRTQAILHNKYVLWAMEIMSVLYVVTGVIMLIVDPQQWPAAVGGLLFFGACAVVFARMLMLRKRAAQA